MLSGFLAVLLASCLALYSAWFTVLDPFDPSVLAAQAEDNTSYLATKVGSCVAVT